jgi:hypothetical protein
MKIRKLLLLLRERRALPAAIRSPLRYAATDIGLEV